MVVSIEQHVEYIRDVISSLDAEGLSTIEATEEAQAEWVAWVNTVAELTLFHGCSSWYLAQRAGKAAGLHAVTGISTTRPTVMPSPRRATGFVRA